MGIFDTKDEVRAALQTKLSDCRSANELLKKQLDDKGQESENLKLQVDSCKMEMVRMEEKLKGLKPQSSMTLKLLRYATRTLGIALLVASAAICKWLAEGNGGEQISFEWGLQILWALYLFCQCAGLFLAAFAPSRSHTHQLVFGSYMSAVTVLLAIFLAFSFRGGPIPYSLNLIGLIAINSLGIWVLINAERIIRFEKNS